ncbi:MAG: acylneuraminate cytidylyltransferase [Pseudolysinimonas sp.]
MSTDPISDGETVVVIPARGGSKGVPGKNLRRVGGIPLIARSITSALAATGVDRVVVSTDDSEIAAVAREWGAAVVDRPRELSGDEASSESAVLHALGVLESSGLHVGVVVLMQATSPFIDAADLDVGIERVRRGECDVAMSAIVSWGFLWRESATGLRGVNHDMRARPRRQDRAPEYLETGAFYVMAADGFVAARHRFFGIVDAVLVTETTALEIDTEEQLVMASILSPLAAPSVPIDVDAVVTDFDGVHTDDTVVIGTDGSEYVTVSRSDGMGVALLREAGISVLVLSTESNAVVGVRAAKLGVDVLQAQTDKASALTAWAVDHGIPLDRIAYLGNDVNDLGCFGLVGWPVAVPDAHPRILGAARVVLGSLGGRGAVRELADLVLHARAALSRGREETHGRRSA